jgi:hypothetical protein
MRAGLNPFSLLVVSMAGWLNQKQQQVIQYLVEENRVLREQIGFWRLRFSDDQRHRLAAKAKKVGRRILAQVATLVTPQTLMAWHRKSIAQKYDGSAPRSPGRPLTSNETSDLVIRWPKRTTVGVIAGFKVHCPILAMRSHGRRSQTF